MRKKVLILTNRPLHNGPRMIREIMFLKDEFDLVAVGHTKPLDASVKFIEKPNFLPQLFERALHKAYRKLTGGRPWAGRFPSINKYFKELIASEQPDLIITHESEFLPYLQELKKQFDFKIVYNAHEYHPLNFDYDPQWLKTKGRFYKELYSKYLSCVDLMVNVNESIAAKCEQDFGKVSIVVPNASFYRPDIKPVYNDAGPIRMIHHGGAIRYRELDLMLEVVKQFPEKVHLDFMLVPTQLPYYNELKEKYEGGNITFIEPVSFNQIVPFINQYDVGFFNLPDKNFNYKYALPNKLYEFIQARLCVVISNSPEMKKVVEKYNVGYVSAGFTVDEMVQLIEGIDREQINTYKKNTDFAAKELGAERYSEYYYQEIKKCLMQ